MLVLTLVARPHNAAAVTLGPQETVGEFCQADALGLRVNIQGWAATAALVGWDFEPAWDHVVLIGGYSVGAPRPATDGGVKVDVQYNVLSTVTALGIDAESHVETVTFRVRTPDGTSWRIDGPPPPPHILGNRVDVNLMRRSLEFGGVNFLADTLFVWQMYRSAGWNVDFKRVGDLLDGTTYRVVETPEAGDLVLYLRDGAPYHVALLESEHQVVSSTLNAGIVRTATEAFPGTVKYVRLIQPEPGPVIPAATAPGAKPVAARTSEQARRAPHPDSARTHVPARAAKLAKRAPQPHRKPAVGHATHHPTRPSTRSRKKKQRRKTAARQAAAPAHPAPGTIEE